jgi:predicted amidophosphoribosyltransferase
VLGILIMLLRLKPVRVCPQCEEKVPQDARRCPVCSYRFTRERGV